MHAVLFTSYVVKKLHKCIYKLCPVLSECAFLRNAEGMKIKSDGGDFHSNLNTLVNFGCNKPQKAKEICYIQTYTEQLQQNCYAVHTHRSLFISVE